MTARSGLSVAFDVKVTGEPQPTITWYHNDKQFELIDMEHLAENAKVKIEAPVPYTPSSSVGTPVEATSTFLTKFTLLRSSPFWAGKWTIKAENVNGVDQVDFNINVAAPPNQPRGPLEVSDVTKNGCQLKWKEPELEGAGKPESYRIEKMDIALGGWVPCGESTKPEADVAGLSEGHIYKFRVIAVNPTGESDPLECEELITAKDPFGVPSKPGVPSCSAWDTDFAEFEWAAPASDGGAPITEYEVEVRRADERNWEKMPTVFAKNGRKCRIPGIEGEEVEVRVYAVNKAGKSLPSNASERVKLRPSKVSPTIKPGNIPPQFLPEPKLAPLGEEEKDKPMLSLVHPVGKTVKFSLLVNGEPTPEVAVFDGEKKLDPKQDGLEYVYEDGELVLKLDNPNRDKPRRLRIVAKNKHGQKEEKVNIDFLGPPGKPEGPLTITQNQSVGEPHVVLHWKPPLNDGGAPIDTYVIEKQDTATGRWVQAGFADAPKPTSDGTTPELDFFLPGLVEGNQYNFRVRAHNSEGDSEPLETEQAIIAKSPWTVPTAPLNVKYADWGRNFVTLEWSPPDSDGGVPIEKYIIEKKEIHNHKFTRGTEFIVPKPKPGEELPDVFSVKVPDLTEGTRYQFQIKAVNKAGAGPPSHPTQPIECKDRFAPARIDDRHGSRTIVLHVGQPLRIDVRFSGEPCPDRYWMFNKEKFDFSGKIQPQAKAAGPSLANKMKKDGEEEAPAAEGPKRPDSIFNTPEERDVFVKSVNQEMEDYRCKINVPSVTRQHNGLWQFKVANQYGSDELDVNVTVIGPPGPVDLNITNLTADTATIKWMPPLDDGGVAIDYYWVEKRRIDESTRFITLGRVKDTSLVATELEEDVAYEFRVRAVNAEGEGEPSIVYHRHLPEIYKPPMKPGVPDVFDWDAEWADLRWAPPVSDGGKPITGYQIEKRKKDGASKWIKIGETSLNEFRAPNLDEGDEYEFRVRAVNAIGASEPSDPSKGCVARARKSNTFFLIK